MDLDDPQAVAPTAVDASTAQSSPGTRAQRGALEARIFGGTAAPASFGRFVVLDKLGEGGMGVVFRAYDPELDRRIAVKVVRTRAGLGSTGRARLLREGRAMGKLTHPNVVTVHDVGIVDDRLFIAMEYVAGSNLSQWAEAHPEHTPARQRQLLTLMRDAARGLAAAHAAGLVHRDLKPANMLVGDDGRLRLADFGLVVQADALLSDAPIDGGADLRDSNSGGHGKLTETGTVLGTPAYMAPEQFDGRADARSDQFSLCASFYEVLYGYRPFAGPSGVERLSGSDNRPVSTPAGAFVPTLAERVLRRGLSVDPEQRYPTVDALLDDLERAIAPRRRGVLLATTGAALVALGAMAVTLRAGDLQRPDCADGSGAAAEVWGDAQRQQLATQLATAGDTASGTTHAVVERFDRFVRQWSDTYAEACRVSADEPDAFELSWSCLAEGKRKLQVRVDVLTQADANTAARALDVVSTLPEPTACADPRELLQREHQRPPAEIADRVQELLDRSDALAVDTSAQKFEGLFERSEALLVEAEALGFAPLIAAASFQRGWARRRFGLAGDDDDYLRAYTSAQEAGDDRLAAMAAVSLAFGYDRNQRVDEALRWIEVGQAAVRRGGVTGRSAYAVGRGRGELYHQAGQSQRALSILEEQYELAAADLELPFEEVAYTEFALARVQYETEHYTDALAHATRAGDILRERLGENHASYAELLRLQARTLLDLGRVDEGVARKREQQRLFAALHVNVEWRSRVIEALFFHDVHLLRAQPDEALTTMLEAEPVVRQNAPESLLLSEVLGNIAERALDVGDLDRATTAAESSLRIAKMHEVGDVRHARAYLVAARVQVERGRTDDAITLLEDALARTPPELFVHAALRGQLAHALWADGRDDARARQLAQEAIERLKQAPLFAAELRRLERLRATPPRSAEKK